MKKVISHIFLVLVISSGVLAQNKALTIDDYERWSRIVGTELSNNGDWISYALRPNGGDDTLHVQSLESEKSYTIPNASNAVFSDDNQWVAYVLSPDEATAKKLRSSKKPVHRTAELLNLSTGEKVQIERANTMAFSNDAQYWMVHRKKPDQDESKHKGSDLIIRNLQTGTVTNIGNVSDFAANKKATHLAYVVDADGMTGNGVYLFDLNTASIRPVHTDSASYEGLTWDDEGSEESEWQNKGNAFAVYFGVTPEEKELKANKVLIVNGIDGQMSTTVLDPEQHSDMPEVMVISEDADLAFTDNGETVMLGLKMQQEKMELSKDSIANVDVWHWNDDRIQTVQMRQYNRDMQFTWATAFHVGSNELVRLADDEMRVIWSSDHDRYQVGRDEEKYREDINWGVTPADLYRVDIQTGKRALFAENIKRTLGYSPDGRYFLYQKIDENDSRMMLYDLEEAKKVDLTANAPVRFENTEHIYPHENPPYGLAGWTKDGKHVILNHKYDLWMISLDGSEATNITKGKGEENKIVFRYVNLDDQEYIDTSKDLMLSAFGEWTKKDGFFTLKMGKDPKELRFEEVSFGRPMKAEDDKTVVLTRETFVEFPDYYVTDTSFKRMKKVTDANAQQAEYAWGSRKLINFENGRGQAVQGTLTLPANYEEGKQYPTIIYFYEKMSDRHHQYSFPRYDDRPHMSTYASNGYAVFMPDILFEEGRPGTSSLDGILAARKALLESGVADPDNIGLQGHSWAGYQTSFILTQTDVFKTIVTGAPPTNLESFYNNIYGNTGTNHHGIMEIGQVRMGRNVTPWSDREAYRRENPMYHAPDINTPFMILHGTEDGAVDWSQGLEFYNAARRLGKEVIFLSYPGEGHHLRERANAIDFQIRMKQYFDHHLMGKKAPAWMEEGIPQTKKLYRKAN